MDSRQLRLMVATACLLLITGCATTSGTPGPSAAAPDYRVGDRWVYRVQDGFRNRVTWEETHRVSAVSPIIAASCSSVRRQRSVSAPRFSSCLDDHAGSATFTGDAFHGQTS